MATTPDSTTRQNPSEDDWRHWLQFSQLLEQIRDLSADVQANVLATKDVERGGGQFHRLMYELRAQLALMKNHVEKFNVMADEYERIGLQRRGHHSTFPVGEPVSSGDAEPFELTR